MYCTNCGHLLPDGVNFCPVCGENLKNKSSFFVSGQSASSATPKCNNQEEEIFYQTHKNSLEGLEAYCAKYPKGFYYMTAKSSVDEIKRRKEQNKRTVMRIFKTIIMIIAFPVILFTMPFFGGGVRISRLLSWYEKDEWL